MSRCRVSSQNFFHIYKVSIDGGTICVCKKAFARLHQITLSKIDFIAKQICDGLTAPHPSLRGFHKKRPNKCPSSSVELVKQHISLYPAESSHYSRNKNSNRLYLSATLSISNMYKQYLLWIEEKCSENNLVTVSERMYRDIFVTEFNLGFGSPSSDTCAVCEVSSKSNDEHKRKFSLAFEQQRKDRTQAASEQNVTYITFDLQKTLPLPKLSVGPAFYLRQLWLYNLRIH